jgi:predicted MFS family arabinose efflux permease
VTNPSVSSRAIESTPAREAAVVCIGVGAVYAAAFALPPAISELDRVARLTHTDAGLILGVFTFSFAVASPVAAHLVRRYPHDVLLPFSVVAAGSLAVIMGTAPPIEVLVAARAVMGFAVAVVLLAGLGAAAPTRPAKAPPLGWVLASVNIGIASSYLAIPVLGLTIGTLSGLRLTGLTIVGIGVGLGGHQYQLHRRPLRPQVPAHPFPKETPKRLATSPGPSTLEQGVLVGLLCCTLFALYGVLTWYPAFLSEQVHLQATALALTAAGLAIGAVPASLIAASAIKNGTHPLSVTAVGYASGATIAILAAAHLTWPPAAAAIGLASVCGLSATLVPLYAVLEPRLLGRANLFAYSGAMIAVWLGGALIGRGNNYSPTFAVFALVATAAASLAAAARSIRPQAWRLNTSLPLAERKPTPAYEP